MNGQVVSEIDVQRRYYAETAHKYDAMHVNEGDEHYFALCLMLAAVDFFGIKSILDIGSGTGRAISQIKKIRPNVLLKGLSPLRSCAKWVTTMA